MSINADTHVVDLGGEFSTGELDTLVQWGATYLSSDDEDATIRAASLALEFSALVWRNAKARGRRISPWQQRLLALGLVTQCVRARQLLAGQVRH